MCEHICARARLQYIASLLVHRKFAMEFVAKNGVQALLRIHRQSIASTGVSLCLYYLAHLTDVMEKVVQLPNDIVDEVIE